MSICVQVHLSTFSIQKVDLWDNSIPEKPNYEITNHLLSFRQNRGFTQILS